MDNRIRHMKSRAFLIVTFLLLIRPVFGQVVINEIFYHSPDDLSDLQWIELLNNSDQPADLSGWRLGKSVQFSFPKGATIAPHGYLVLCKNREQFQQFYSAPVGGQFESAFKKGEGHLELRDATGHVVDAVDFTDRAPWPRGAAGHTASLERICPAAPGNVPENWTDSPLSDDDTKPGGSPAAQNSAFSAKLPPIVSNVTFRPARAQADEPIEVQARISSPVPIQEVNVLYRLVEPGTESEEKVVPMKAAGAEGQYSAIIPGQKAGQIVRFRVQATDSNSAQRLFPSPTDLHPALSCLVLADVPKSKIPIGLVIHPDAAEVASSKQQQQNGGMPSNPEGSGAGSWCRCSWITCSICRLFGRAHPQQHVPVGRPGQAPSVLCRQSRERDQLQEQTLASQGSGKGCAAAPRTQSSRSRRSSQTN